MQRFRYCRDPLFVIGCAAYAINRWLVKPHVHMGFFHSHFNDCWLIPCALPPVLWLHQFLRLRHYAPAPQVSEILLHLLFWSVLFEWIGPRFMPHTTADPLDVIAYAAGATVNGLWWHRECWLKPVSNHEF